MISSALSPLARVQFYLKYFNNQAKIKAGIRKNHPRKDVARYYLFL